jgi:hypothetical protein
LLLLAFLAYHGSTTSSLGHYNLILFSEMLTFSPQTQTQKKILKKKKNLKENQFKNLEFFFCGIFEFSIWKNFQNKIIIPH